VLATEITAMLHGRQAAEQAAETARKTFEDGVTADSLPSVEMPRTELEAGIGILALFVKAGLAGSNGEVRRAVANNALSINDQRVGEATGTVTDADLNADGLIKLSHGRKKHVLVRAT
jgi:tyrosyl-tRNA synthetase